ncbi:MAG TPA: hypothetical protein VHV10_08315, partial [Ktedonobacteraceae bacterium]|nr:hypothetical protein [Ktedonobacteraceae bacterium]
MTNATNPCGQDSLGWLFTCLNDQCMDSASDITLMLTPKAQYSCQDSLIPGIENSSSPMTVAGDASCVTNPYDFKSFIPSTGPASQMDTVAQKCELELFPGE